MVGPPPQGPLWMHHVLCFVACGSVAPVPGILSKGCLLPRGHGLGGEQPLVPAQGALLKVPVLPCRKRAGAIAGGCSSGEHEADFARMKFSRWFLSKPSPPCRCLAESRCSCSLPLCVLHGARWWEEGPAWPPWRSSPAPDPICSGEGKDKCY